MSHSIHKPPAWGYPALAFCGLFWLVFYVVTSERGLFFDEIYLFKQVGLLATADSFRAWLLANDSMAMGPVHSLLYYALWGGEVPAPWMMRLPNLGMLVLTLAAIAFNARQMMLRRPLAVSLAALGVPMTWVAGGIALSEMPAMMAIAIALLAAVRIGADLPASHGDRRMPWLLLLAVGITLGVTTRQIYLVVVPSLGLLALRNRADLPSVAAAIGAGLILPIALFTTWGGVTPPLMRAHISGFEPQYAVYAVCSLGAISLMLAPRFFGERWRISLGMAIAAGLIQLLFRPVAMDALTSAQRYLPHPFLAQWGTRLLIAGMVAAGAAWIVALAEEVVKRRDRQFIALALAVVLLCGVCAAIRSQYSSRYVALALPFLLPLLGRWMDFGVWGILRLLGGMSIGALVLHTYYVHA